MTSYIHTRLNAERWRPARTRIQAFSLLELMVATAILLLILVMIFNLTTAVTKTVKYSKSKIETFREARIAFDTITRRLSQATLNTYWDYEPQPPSIPKAYVRQSELHFIVGKTEALLGTSTPPRPGHGVFFQAPFGFETSSEAKGLPNLLNCWGFFLEFNSDLAWRPTFISTSILPARYRYRLMQFMLPSSQTRLYSYTSGNPAYNGLDWFKLPLSQPSPPATVLAENIVAMIFLPRYSTQDDPNGNRLAPNYTYDSRQATGITRNQLPPLVQVTFVVIDEESAARLANGSINPDFGVSGLFNSSAQSDYDQDLQTLQSNLTDRRANYRIFSEIVPIASSKWSEN